MGEVVGKTPLYVGTTPDVNYGVVSTNKNHLNGDGREIGWHLSRVTHTG